MKTKDRIIALIDNGYGLNQIMEACGINQAELIKIAETEVGVLPKLQKRFRASRPWVNDIVFKGKDVVAENDTPELALLKAEAKELSIAFSPNIGAETLKRRINDYKASKA